MGVNSILGASNIVGGNRTEGKREANDFYPTPSYVTEALLKRESFEGSIWEPACGKGDMSEVLIKNGFEVFSSDLIDRGYGEHLNFLDSNNIKHNNIITNPPFKFGKEFVEKALECSDKKVAMLLKLVFLESTSRYELFQNTPLKTVYVFSKRINFYANEVIDKPKTSGTIAFAWFVWEHGYKGKPTIEWIK